MTHKKWTLLVYVTLVALLMVPVVAAAQPTLQDPDEQEPYEAPAEVMAVEADLAAGFYYQGLLTERGSPVNGTRQMEFRLYNASSGGSQVGSTKTMNVSVSKGQFNVALTWGANEIDGKALWLRVRAKDGGGTWRDLGRKRIRAVPYAMSLYPGAKVIKSGSGNDVLYLEAKGTDFALRAIARHGSYDGVYATGGDDGLYGVTTGATANNVGVYGYAGASTGAARGGHFYSRNGIGLYAMSDRLEGVYGRSDKHDGVTGRSKVAGKSGVYGYSEKGHGVYGRAGDVNGYGVWGQNNNSKGVGVAGFMGGYAPADLTAGWWKPAGLFGGRNGVVGLTKETGGVGVVAECTATSGSGCRGIHARTNSTTGWAGKFDGSGNGIYISVPSGKKGLQVASGTKSAVVGTSDGSRLLYTEEATEVWFADYGFGRLQDGLAVVSIDSVFAQTVNLEEPYHVFIQAYGNAELYVANRTSAQFEVHLRDGDPNVEFSYRLVASRLGYEGQRLERAPEADSDPNLYPEKRTELEAQAALSNGWVLP